MAMWIIKQIIIECNTPTNQISTDNKLINKTYITSATGKASFGSHSMDKNFIFYLQNNSKMYTNTQLKYKHAKNCNSVCTKSRCCLITGQHFIFAIIYLLLPIKCIIFDSVSKILFIFLLSIIIIMILMSKILLHNVYKIINLWYPTYVYQFFNFPYNYKIECWPVFKQDPKKHQK